MHKVEIRNGQGKVLPQGDIGDIWIKSWGVAKGYWVGFGIWVGRGSWGFCADPLFFSIGKRTTPRRLPNLSSEVTTTLGLVVFGMMAHWGQVRLSVI